MKRELKEVFVFPPNHNISSYTACPDEEGTESSWVLALLLWQQRSYTACPDEEGTESAAWATHVVTSGKLHGMSR